MSDARTARNSPSIDPTVVRCLSTTGALRLDALIAELASSGDATLVSMAESLAVLDANAACRMVGGDVNLDGEVDAADVTLFLGSWTAGDLVHGDLNRDGAVDGLDLAIFAAAQSEPVAATAD